MGSAAAAFAGLSPGMAFGAYDIVRCVGVGGMGTVFEATHRLMERRVALKVLHAVSTPGFDVRERFMREGATMVRITHPNIVTVYDAGAIDGVPYIAMEFLEGETLDRLLVREGVLDALRTVRLLAPVAEGLGRAHDLGIVHRDVKPENLLVTRDDRGHEFVKLVDFGIAKDTTTGGRHNTVVGTPSYMSPEQLLGGAPVDGRSDQFSLAVVVYQAVVGKKPFEAASVLELAELLERDVVVPPSTLGVNLPDSFERALCRALRTPPELRHPDVHAFAAALRDSVTDEDGRMPPLSSSRNLRPVVAAPRTTSPTVDETEPTLAAPISLSTPLPRSPSSAYEPVRTGEPSGFRPTVAQTRGTRSRRRILLAAVAIGCAAGLAALAALSGPTDDDATAAPAASAAAPPLPTAPVAVPPVADGVQATPPIQAAPPAAGIPSETAPSPQAETTTAATPETAPQAAPPATRRREPRRAATAPAETARPNPALQLRLER